MTIKENAYDALKSLGGRATEKKLVEQYIIMFPEYDKNYNKSTQTPSIQKIRGTISRVLSSSSAPHKNIRYDKSVKDYEYFIVDDIIYPDDILDKKLKEGSRKEIVVNAYERNPQARRECLEYYGYNCSICDFNFKDIYGIIGENYIHVHHLKPLSEIGEKYTVDPINDLRPVCPNCHSMLHKVNPPYSIEDIKVLLKFQSKRDLPQVCP